MDFVVDKLVDNFVQELLCEAVYMYIIFDLKTFTRTLQGEISMWYYILLLSVSICLVPPKSVSNFVLRDDFFYYQIKIYQTFTKVFLYYSHK